MSQYQEARQTDPMSIAFEPDRLLVEGTISEPRCLRAASGLYRLVLVLQRETSDTPLGVVHFAFGNQVPFWDTSSLRTSEDLAPDSVNTNAIALGPLYREADGSWIPLAGLPASWYDAWLDIEQESGQFLSWSVTWKLYAGPVIEEFFSLAPSGLEYVCRMQWTIPGFRLQIPVALSRPSDAPKIEGSRLILAGHGYTLVAHCQTSDSHWILQPLQLPSAAPCYLRALLHSPQAVEYRITLNASEA
jgi:hypothetical protein